MYAFRPVTDRIQKFRDIIRDRVIQNDAERAVLLTEAYQLYEGVTPVIKIPLATYYTCERATVRMEDFEILVGSKSKYFPGSGVTPTWGESFWILDEVDKGNWTLREDGLYHNNETEDGCGYTIAPEDVEAFRAIRPFWKTHMIATEANAFKPDGYDDFVKLQVTLYGEHSMMMIPIGHLTPGFQKIVNVGYGAIRKQAQDWLDAHEGDIMGGEANKYLFYKSVTIVCDAATLLVRRYAHLCREKLAECADEKRRAELEMMADGLEWISENPARTFWEACQATLMYQLFLNLDSGLPGSAFGRFDQYTWPFLEKDLEEGRLTLDGAQEIVDAFFLKANCFYSSALPEMAKIAGVGSTYQHTTIGGYDRETGRDGTNPVTYMVLETLGRLKLHDPTVSLRITKDSPDELWECALETSRLVGGLPLFQNDDVIIPGIIRELGFELKDARDYSFIGCQEIVGSGTDYPAPNGVHPPYASVHFGAVLTMALNDGKNPLGGAQCKLHTGYLYDMNSIEEVREAYVKLSNYVFRWLISLNNYTEYYTKRNSPHAALSISMEGCMEKGLDATEGGCKYNSFGGTAPGLATVADSLTAIKYMCFDQKLCSTRELYDAVMANWVGYEDLRQFIANKVPHFGNDDPYADMEKKFCVETYYALCDEVFSSRTKKYKPGLYGAADHIAQGYVTWATPDGRKSGEPLADAASPAQSRDKNGPTAIFKSSVCYDHTRCMGGMALNLRLHPTALESEDGVAKLRDMTKAYFAMDGMEVQYNVVSSDTLRKAQARPEEYRNLVVRIAGYSAYFIELGTDLQNDIISRTEGRLS
jgi:formate C-acetyltransferase